MGYTDENSATIDGWIKEGWEWGENIDHETYINAKNGVWDVVLTPVKPVPRHWFGELKGAKLLGLASGGGQQMPIFVAAGAQCTVLDYSQGQIDSENRVAQREGYNIEAIRGDMTKKLPFDDNSFDIIFHPVSNCFIEDVKHVFDECYRILKKGGILLAGLDNGINYIVDFDDETKISVKLPYNPLKDKKIYEKAMEVNDGIQFSHTMEEQIGCQLKAGFTLVDIYEDTNGQGHLHDLGIPTFIATKAVK